LITYFYYKYIDTRMLNLSNVPANHFSDAASIMNENLSIHKLQIEN